MILFFNTKHRLYYFASPSEATYFANFYRAHKIIFTGLGCYIIL